MRLRFQAELDEMSAEAWPAFEGSMATAKGGMRPYPGNWYLEPGIRDPLFWLPSHFVWAKSAHHLGPDTGGLTVRQVTVSVSSYLGRLVLMEG